MLVLEDWFSMVPLEVEICELSLSSSSSFSYASFHQYLWNRQIALRDLRARQSATQDGWLLAFARDPPLDAVMEFDRGHEPVYGMMLLVEAPDSLVQRHYKNIHEL